MVNDAYDQVRALRFDGARLSLLDQRQLPGTVSEIHCEDAADVAAAIRDMVIRGAPAIGIAAAYGVVLAVAHRQHEGESWRARLQQDLDLIAGARPTAVNLAWAVRRMSRVIEGARDPAAAARREAERIHEEDVAANRRIGEHGADFLEARTGRVRGVLTHCNTGSLATGGYGTALGVIRSLAARGQADAIFVDETRPWLQGSRLTAWELAREGLPATVLVDGAAPALLASGAVDAVVVGADRVTANGDVVNKIGTYMLALAAHHHGIPFLVAVPASTVDGDTASGDDVPIELRDDDEVLACQGQRIAAPGARAWNPVFDVTPAHLVSAVVTEHGPAVRHGVPAAAR